MFLWVKCHSQCVHVWTLGFVGFWPPSAKATGLTYECSVLVALLVCTRLRVSTSVSGVYVCEPRASAASFVEETVGVSGQ